MRMKIKMILPALTEAKSPFFRPIKYSLFPPLGLATLAGYLNATDEIELQDEHVETLNLADTPDLVVIQVYITSAYRAYDIADHYREKGVHVALGGLHVTSLPEEAAHHADTIFLGPGEDTPNSIVVSRGCPHKCDFCYKDAFFKGGKGFYTQTVDWAVAHGIETATFHILTPYPGTRLYERMAAQGRLLHSNWDLYDTRHTVFQPAKMNRKQLEAGYWQAYRNFYRWGAIWRGVGTKQDMTAVLRHLAYAGGRQKFEPLWDVIIRLKQVSQMLPLLEKVLAGLGNRSPEEPQFTSSAEGSHQSTWVQQQT